MNGEVRRLVLKSILNRNRSGYGTDRDTGDGPPGRRGIGRRTGRTELLTVKEVLRIFN